MSDRVRVLVVDDSALMRQMIRRFLEEAGFEVVATARDGLDGLQKARELRPDVITLDVEMPRLDGLGMLRELMNTTPTPVVMLSSLTQKQAPVAIEALALGAVDVVGKPGGTISLNLEEVRDELIRKVSAAAKSRPRLTMPSRSTVTVAPPAEKKAGKRPQAPSPGIVIIGCSTGGPGALTSVIPALPADFPLPVIIVQHMPPGFTASLAARLDASSRLRVQEAKPGIMPEAGQVWVAPGGFHLVFERRVMRLSDAPPVHGVKPAVDPALETAVDDWGAGVVAAILTGMGMDGARGARKVKRAGGWVVAQDEETSVIFGMPRAVIEMGFADQVLPLNEIAPALVSRARAVVKNEPRLKGARP